MRYFFGGSLGAIALTLTGFSSPAQTLILASSTDLRAQAPELTPELPVLTPGMTGEAVLEAQTALRDLNYYTGDVDGVYGPATVEAVTALQTNHDLTADGILGPATWQLIEQQAQSRIVQWATQLPTVTGVVFSELTPAPPDPPPSPLWLVLMPLIPLAGGGLTYLQRQASLKARAQAARRNNQENQSP